MPLQLSFPRAVRLLALSAGLSIPLSPSGCTCGPEPAPTSPPPPPVPTARLVVPAGAAGCEVLLQESAGALSVAFGDNTRGTAVREAPKVAVAAVVTSGEPDITVTGAFAIASSRCVNAAGADVGEVQQP